MRPLAIYSRGFNLCMKWTGNIILNFAQFKILEAAP